ncbi:MAG: glycosyltransferase family 39 protein, partial [Acidobacteriota bacterium]
MAALFIPLAGIQNDEALFSSPLYANINQDLAAKLWRFEMPMMVMTYLGSLKSLLFWPILSLFGANLWSIRLPVVLLGAASVSVFYHFLRNTIGPRAALAGAFLLATDPIYLLTNTFDWGPVAVEHFLLVTACWAFHQFGTRTDTTGSFWV